MRVDDFLSTVGAVKRRTIAKKLCDSGMIEINGSRAKASKPVTVSDIVSIKGSRPLQIEVLDVPTGSVPKGDREKYFRQISST